MPGANLNEVGLALTACVSLVERATLAGGKA